MAESTLSLTYADLLREVGRFIGYGSDNSTWTTKQATVVDDCIRAGLRSFYFCSPGQDWSFLKPVTTISTAAVTGAVTGQGTYSALTGLTTVNVASGTLQTRMAGFNFTFGTSDTAYVINAVASTSQLTLVGNASAEASGDTYTVDNMEDYDLPDDFGAVAGSLTYLDTSYYNHATFTSEYEIRRMRAIPQTGAPQYAAVRQTTFAATNGQRWELLLYPRPAETISLSLKYSVLPNMLTDTLLYPYGGAQHADTIKAACFAAVESDINEVSNGPWAAKFQERLAASIALERKFAPDNLGYNSNGPSNVGVWNEYSLTTNRQL